MNWSKRIGKSRGHFSAKENRAQKLVDEWMGLKKKMEGMISRGHCTSTTARCAYGILLMMETGIRVGNESSAEGYVCQNKYLPQYGRTIKTYGLTSIEVRHVSPNGRRVDFQFLGKKGEHQALVVKNMFLTRCAHEITDSKKKSDLFLGISCSTLKRFVKKYVGQGFTPKDIRTAKVNLEFVTEIEKRKREAQAVSTKREMKVLLAESIETVAERIGHTKGVCKRSYISQHLLADYTEYLESRVEVNK